MTDSPQLLIFDDGPLNRFLNFMGLAGSDHVDVLRRIFFWIFVGWFPPILLALLASMKGDPLPTIDIYQDITYHVRSLISIPIILSCEVYVQNKIKDVVPTLKRRGMLNLDKTIELNKVIERILKLQKSPVEMFLVILSLYFVTIKFYIEPYEASSWKVMDVSLFKLASKWDLWVGRSIYNFFILRWLWRFILWSYFLIKLVLIKPLVDGLHPDQLGGLSFLVLRHIKFGLISLATSSLVSANIAASIVYGGISLEKFFITLITYSCLIVIFFMLPLLAFTPLLVQTKRSGIGRYADFAYSYIMNFEHKWLGGRKVDRDPLGSADIQSYSDLCQSYEHLRGMSLFLMTRKGFISLVLMTFAPLLPLVLFKIPLVDIIKLVFMRLI